MIYIQKDIDMGYMSKADAIAIYGISVVEKARDMYETDYGKVLFQEDCSDGWDIPASIEVVIDRCSRAKMILSK